MTYFLPKISGPLLDPGVRTPVLLLMLALYCLLSAGIFRMAKNRGIDYAWLSWIPIMRCYIIGELVGEKIVLFRRTIVNIQLILPILTIIAGMFSGVPVAGLLLIILWLVLIYAIAWRIFRLYDFPLRGWCFAACLVCPVMLWVFPFIFRKRTFTEYL